jgi:hypothetical protein
MRTRLNWSFSACTRCLISSLQMPAISLPSMIFAILITHSQLSKRNGESGLPTAFSLVTRLVTRTHARTHTHTQSTFYPFLAFLLAGPLDPFPLELLLEADCCCLSWSSLVRLLVTGFFGVGSLSGKLSGLREFCKEES